MEQMDDGLEVTQSVCVSLTAKQFGLIPVSLSVRQFRVLHFGEHSLQKTRLSKKYSA